MYVALLLPLNPNVEQTRLFWQYAGTARWAYNWALDQWQAAYMAGGKRPSAYDLQKRITLVKREEETRWLAGISNHIPEQAIKAADTGFKNFFRGLKSGRKVGFPKRKSRQKSGQSFSFNVSALHSIHGKHVVIPKLGEVRIARRHFMIPDNGRALRLTISHKGDKWYASILYEIPDVVVPPNGGPDIGIDLGLTTFATLSTGEKIESPKPLKAAMVKLKRKQRRLSASINGSHRREKKRRILARLHDRVRNIRHTFLNALSARMAKNHGRVFIEDLSVANMMRNHYLARAIGDAGWGEFSRQLSYKCPRFGSQLVIADRWFASSKTCSCCGQIVKSLPLSVRKWTCDGCGSVHDRDINAAINLVQLPANSGKDTPAETGDQGRRKMVRCRSLNRELVSSNGSH